MVSTGQGATIGCIQQCPAARLDGPRDFRATAAPPSDATVERPRTSGTGWLSTLDVLGCAEDSY